jgi:ATP-dependent RNA helicase DDX54/DBP10
LKRQRHHSQLTWDKKKKKFIKGTGEGADNAKMVKTESGTKLPASYRSGRFEEWQNRNRLRLPRVGEQELPQARLGPSHGGNRKFKHTKMTAPKTLDKQHLSFERKSRLFKKRAEEGNGAVSMEGEGRARGRNGKAGKSRYGDKPIGRVKNEIKTVDQIRKARDQAAKRKAKNARPTKKKGRR